MVYLIRDKVVGSNWKKLFQRHSGIFIYLYILDIQNNKYQ